MKFMSRSVLVILLAPVASLMEAEPTTFPFSSTGATPDQSSGKILTTTKAPVNMGTGVSIERVQLTAEGELHGFYRQPAQIVLTSNPPIIPPDSRWKEIYGVKDGKIVFLRKVYATVTPASAEKVEWPK